MIRNICRFCGAYRPYEKLFGYLGICETHGMAKGVDDSCEDFSEGAQTWLCGVPVKDDRKRHADHR